MSSLVQPRIRSSHDIMPRIVAYREQELEKHLPRDPFVFYITDLVRCSRKREFELSHPKLMYVRVASGRTFLGDTVHRGLESMLKEIFGDSVVVEYEGGTERYKEVFVDGVKYIVKGRIDAILNGDTGVEIKETVSHGSLPYQHHVEQCMLYNWLYGFRRTLLLYVSPDGIYEFEVVDRFSDEDVVRRIKEPRSPRYEWECELCEFRSICSTAKLVQANTQKKQRTPLFSQKP